MSNPTCETILLKQLHTCGLAFRIEDGWLDAIIAFDANLSEERLGYYTPPPYKAIASKVAGRSEMRANPSPFILVKSASSSMRKQPTFRTGEPIPESGIYRVIHKAHRLPHEVTLVWGQAFPRCAKMQGRGEI